MLEHETEIIKQIVLDSTIGSRGAIRLNEVVAATLPRGVKTYICAHVTKLLESDFKQTPRLSRIAKDTGERLSRERVVIRALAMEYVLERDEYVKLVQDTIHFLGNYLCRPQWTLNQLMFEGKQDITFRQMTQNFEYVADYKYFGTLLERHARRKGWTLLRNDQVKNLIERIDEEIIRQNTPEQIAYLAQPIFDFFLFGNTSMTRSIPVGAIVLFYEDKKLSTVRDCVEKISRARSRSHISMKELIEAVEELYGIQTATQEKIKTPEQNFYVPTREEPSEEKPPVAKVERPQTEEPFAPPRQDTRESGGIIREKSPNALPDIGEAGNVHPARPVPQTNRTTEDRLAEQVKEDTSVRRTANPESLVSYAAERQASRHALFLTFPEGRAKNQSSLLPDVEQLLSDSQQEKFASEIFGGDEERLRTLLASINKAQSWSEAQLLLREVFTTRRVDILSPDVVEFTDIMHARFLSDLKTAE